MRSRNRTRWRNSLRSSRYRYSCALIGNAGEERFEQVLQPAKSLTSNRSYNGHYALLAASVSGQVVQQTFVQALAYFLIWVAQTVVGPVTARFGLDNRQIAGLEQQGFGGNMVNVEGR